MIGMFKHFMLITLLILHTGWGTVMAAQMYTFHFQMGNPESTVSERAIKTPIATIDAANDNTAGKPCPHHAAMLADSNSAQTQPTTQPTMTLSLCSGLDCSDCDCVNVLSSMPSITETVNHSYSERSIIVVFIDSIFPDSPPSSILRPPIS